MDPSWAHGPGLKPWWELGMMVENHGTSAETAHGCLTVLGMGGTEQGASSTDVLMVQGSGSG